MISLYHRGNEKRSVERCRMRLRTKEFIGKKHSYVEVVNERATIKKQKLYENYSSFFLKSRIIKDSEF